MKPWRVIVEHSGRRDVVFSSPSHKRCLGVAMNVPRVKGLRVILQQEDSADQLHVTRTGRVIRDQPHLPATGEAKVMNVLEVPWQTK